MNILLLATTQTTNCYPLTVNKPNALLKVFNKTLLEYAIESLSVHSKDISIVIQKDHQSLFEELAIDERYKIEVVDELSQIDKLISDADLVLDAANYHPKTAQLDDLKNEMFEIKYAWDLISCQEKFYKNVENKIDGEVEPHATIHGNVTIGKGTVIKNGTYIEGHIVIGDNCTIGPNCYIRGVCAIGDNCRIGNAVEIKNSIIGNNINLCHLSYFGDGILGDDVTLGAGFINSNIRHDGASNITRLNGEKIDTHRRKLGAIIGDGVHTGINTSVYPGRKIWPNLHTVPGAIIDKDIEM